MKKKHLFLGGLGQPTKKERELVSRYFKLCEIDWNKVKTQPIRTKDTLIGFSLGANLAINYAMKNKVKHLILCSPTPDEHYKVKADKVTYILGEKEKWLIDFTKKEHKCKPILVPKTGHEINRAYIDTIFEVLLSRI